LSRVVELSRVVGSNLGRALHHSTYRIARPALHHSTHRIARPALHTTANTG
jgi:hypothetical protein